MARALNPLESVMREVLRPKCILNHHQRGYVHWDWDQADGLRCRIEQPRRDFVFTPIFASLLGAANVTLFGSVTVANVLSAVAVTALTIGLQYALAPKPPKPEDGHQPMAQPIPYRLWGVGECRVAGAYMLWEGKGGNLYAVLALVGHRIDSITAYYLHDDKVSLTGGGWVISPNGQRYGDGTPYRVHLQSRLGLVPETPYAGFVNTFSAKGIWTNDHRGDGQASLAMSCSAPKAEYFARTYSYGAPQPSVVAKLSLVWDFRDETQDPDDPTTWKWSSNSVLILAWHLCFNPFGEKQDYHRAILPVLDMWQEEADVCDEDVPLDIGGSEKRYTCSGFDRTDHGPKSGTNAILATMDGWMCTRGDGAVLIVAGKYREKYCATLTDSDVTGYVNQRGVFFDEEINRFTPKFNYPATDYNTTDADFFEDVPGQIQAGRVLPEEGHYDWCTQWRQARRLGKRDWIRIQEKSRGSIYANLTGINAAYAPWIKLETPVMIPALNGKVIANRKTTLDIGKGGLAVEFAKMPDNPTDIDQWDPATDEGSAPPIPKAPDKDEIPEPTIDSLIVVSSGGGVYLRMSLIEPSKADLTPSISYRVADIGGGTPGTWIEQQFPDVLPESGLILLNTNPVPGDQTLDVRASYIGVDNSRGPYTAVQQVVSTVDNTPPQDLTTFSTTDGTGQFMANISTVNDPHLVSVAIYRTATGVALNKATDLAARPAVSPGVSYAIPITAPAGTWDIYAEPLNRSGIAGTLEGPAPVTVS